MKYILSIALFFSYFQLFSQNQDTISVSFADVTIPEAISEIERVSKFKFYYLNEWFGNEKVSGNYLNQSIEVVLNDVFKSTVLNFYVYKGVSVILTKNNVIYDTLSPSFFDIIPKEDRVEDIETEKEAEVVSNPVFFKEEETIVAKVTDTITPVKISKEEKNPTQEKYKLSGFLRNDRGESLSNMSVSVQGMAIGIETD